MNSLPKKLEEMVIMNSMIFRTGEICEQTGNYVSESGQKSRLQEGEKFPRCPVNGNETTWSNAD